MNTINIQYWKSQIGELIIGSFDKKLCLLNYRHKKIRTAVDNRIKTGLNATFIEKDDDILKKARKQLNQYFEGKRKKFDIPLLTVGTPFQKSVWNALLNVPYGTTSSYLKLATSIKNKKAIRAVASANGANAISVIIPCHRIIGSDGSLVGYGGGLNTKKQLLELESHVS